MFKQMYFYMVNMLMMLILVGISMLISVAFLTLMERKFLGYMQIRKGPNKLGFKGLIQPFSDAIKLLSKEFIFMNKINYFLFIYSPIFMFMLMMMMWMIYFFWTNYLDFSMSFIYLMCCLSLSVYGLMMSGWASNSSYSLLGSIRSLAQSISYEVSLSIMMIITMLMVDSYNLADLGYIQEMGMWVSNHMYYLSLVFFWSIMAELNRTPFDFSEGESELVSGFNVEYSSIGFIFIFLSEYMSIMFLSYLYIMFYMGGDFWSMFFYLKVLMMMFVVIWMRGCLPRFRYDLLMYLCWMLILPVSLNHMFYMIMIKLIIYK